MKNNHSKYKKAVEHIVYEIMMFHGTVLKLVANPQDQFEKNILLESFAIHSRNLFDFFYSKKKQKDDISYEDFIARKMEFKSRRTKKRILKNLTKKTNKQIAHLSYSRNNYNRITKGWNVTTIYKNMNKTIVAFYNCMEPEKKKWFIEYHEKYNFFDIPSDIITS